MTTCDTQATDNPADADRLWQRFFDARSVAMESLEIADGAAAGRAWARFLAVYVGTPPLVPSERPE